MADETPKLTRQYLTDHKTPVPAVVANELTDELTDEQSYTVLRNHILDAAIEEIGDGEADELTVTVSYKLAANAKKPPKRGCVWVNVGFVKVHFPFDGSFPG